MGTGNNKTGGRLHYAWVIVAGCVLISMTGTAILVNGMGIFLKPVSELLGFSRAQFAVVYTCSALMTMLCSPLMGNLMRGYSPRHLIGFCAAFASALLFGYSLCSQLWQFYLIGALSGICTSGLSTLAISSVLNNWFVQKKGTALGIASSGSGFGSMILTPIISHIIENVGWKPAFWLLAIIVAGVNLPVCLFILRNRPADMGLTPYGSEEGEGSGALDTDETSIMNREALKLPAYWLLGASFLLGGLLSMGTQQHLYAYLTDIGHSAPFAAGIISFMMGSLIVGKLALGAVYDRFGVVAGTVSVCLACTAAMILLHWARLPAMVYLFACVFGVGYAIMTVPSSNLTSRLLGSKDYSANYGIINFCMYAGMSMGSPISGRIYDTTGAYTYAWILYAALSVVVLGLLLYVIKSLTAVRQRKAEEIASINT